MLLRRDIAKVLELKLTSVALSCPGNPTIIPTSKLLDDGVVHAFLIRSPEGTVPSWYKVVSSPTIDYKGFVPEEIGIHEVRILYDFIASKSSQPPLVIDSDSIVKDPVKVLQKLCPIADIEYREDMLNWEATAGRAKELFDKWPEWRKSPPRRKAAKSAFPFRPIIESRDTC